MPAPVSSPSAFFRSVLSRSVLSRSVLSRSVVLSRPAPLASLAMVIVSLIAVTPASAVTASMTDWGWPVNPPHTISAPYEAPATPYAAGHRGIDLLTSGGDPVLAPADGVVTFVGTVVDRPVLAIGHNGDLVSSFEPVVASVVVGDRVASGQQIGTVAIGGHCMDCLHFGVRLHGEYVSPLLLLGGIPRAVLLPLEP